MTPGFLLGKMTATVEFSTVCGKILTNYPVIDLAKVGAIIGKTNSISKTRGVFGLRFLLPQKEEWF